MYIGVKSVEALPEYKLLITFENNEKRIFNVTPYLDHGIFSELKDISKFKSVEVKFDSIEWSNGADLDPEILYSESTSDLSQYIA